MTPGGRANKQTTTDSTRATNKRKKYNQHPFPNRSTTMLDRIHQNNSKTENRIKHENSPAASSHKATQRTNNTRTTAIERSVKSTGSLNRDYWHQTWFLRCSFFLSVHKWFHMWRLFYPYLLFLISPSLAASGELYFMILAFPGYLHL